MALPDRELILRIIQNDHQAFDELFSEYKTAVYRFVHYLTQNQNEADDLFQETWFRVVKYLPVNPDLLDFKAWIFRIAANLHRDALRKKKIRRIFQSPEDLPERFDKTHGSETENNAPDPAEQISFQLALEQGIATLDWKKRRVFILKEIEGFKLQEISSILNLPLGTVKSLLHRAHKILQKELADFR